MPKLMLIPLIVIFLFTGALGRVLTKQSEQPRLFFLHAQSSLQCEPFLQKNGYGFPAQQEMIKNQLEMSNLNRQRLSLLNPQNIVSFVVHNGQIIPVYYSIICKGYIVDLMAGQPKDDFLILHQKMIELKTRYISQLEPQLAGETYFYQWLMAN